MPGAPVTPLAAPGWFGKLPHLGDFASRRLPPGFVRRWDRWLQRGLAGARGQLGERWPAVYLVAPILRFWVGPKVLDEHAWAGLMMPSVDRVGRHFPLTIAQVVDPQANDGPLPNFPGPSGAGSREAEAWGHSLAAALASRAWFRALDAAARQALDANFSVDDLEQALSALPAVDPLTVDDTAQRLAEHACSGCNAPPTAPAPAPGSLWWCGDAGEDAEFRCFAALPPTAAFVSMLESAP